jgi:hypothetical protein
VLCVFKRTNIKKKLYALIVITRGIRDNGKGNSRDTKQLLAAVFTNTKD